MSNWFKRLFIPHVGNAYRPHFLLTHNVRQMIGMIVGFELIVFIFPTLFFANFIETLNLSAVLPGVLSTLTNEERGRNSLPQLTESPLLSQVAQLKANDMAANSYFAHTSPEGKTPWHWFKLVGYSYTHAGENLAVSFTDSHDVTRAWMNSPSHRANIIGKNYREIGTGAATGTYKGAKTVFVAQVYGSPRNPRTLTGAVPVSPIWDKAIASPHQSANLVILIVLAVALAAVLLNVFIKFDQQHPDLLRNGVLLLLVASGFYFSNNYLVQEDFETSFMAFEELESGEILPE